MTLHSRKSTTRSVASRKWLLLAMAITAVLIAACEPADKTPPRPVTAFTATGGSGEITLRWTNPPDADLAGVLLVRKVGTTAPTSVTDGTRVAPVAKPGVSYVDKLLDAGTRYSYAAFAYDKATNYASPVATSAVTAATPPAVVRICEAFTTSITLTPQMAGLFVIDCPLTVPTGQTLTFGAGAVVKVRSSINVEGTLQSTGTASSPAVVTSIHDDSVGGDSDGATIAPSDNLYYLDLQAKGRIVLDRADLRYGRLWDYSVGANGGASAVVTNSTTNRFGIDLRYGFANTGVRLHANTFTRSWVTLSTDAPTIQSNTFADGADALSQNFDPGSPLYVSGAGDLALINANTATGTGPQRVLTFVASHVRTTWTLDPASAHIYNLADITVDPAATMTFGAGSVSKLPASASIHVAGTLQSTGTASSPAVVTSIHDDSVGGDSDGATIAPSDNLYYLDLQAKGRIVLDRADLRYGRLWDYSVGFNGGASAVVTNSTTNRFGIDLRYGFANTGVRLHANTFTRSWVTLSTDAPTIQSNTFADGADALSQNFDPGSPLYVSGAGDLALINANTATGTARQRVLTFVASHVRTTWTLDPASAHIYNLADITVDPAATMNVTSGAVLKNNGALVISGGGTLNADGARFTSLGDNSVAGDTDPSGTVSTWPGIDVKAGSTVTISGSTFTNAFIAIEANTGAVTPYAGVNVSGSVFYGNTFKDVSNGFKDLAVIGAPVSLGDSVAANVSSHGHLCVPPPDTALPPMEIEIWDVERTGITDGRCLPTYREESGHP